MRYVDVCARGWLSGLLPSLLVMTSAVGCSASNGGGDTTGENDGDTGDTDGDAHESETISHRFPTITLQPYEERLPCVSWTLNNDEPLYVQAVTLANTGGYHHTNGFVVPEDVYDGPDGIWDCSERGFNTAAAATLGTVLFAQSTQSIVEEQRFVPGAVIKIPPHHRVVAELHLLNLASREIEADFTTSLELLHPRHVDTVLTPFAMQFTDLQIPAQSKSRFTARCDALDERFGPAWSNVELHWVLPHYHYLGSGFGMEIIGGERDGDPLHTVGGGFDADAIGKRFEPAVAMSDASGLTMSCEFDNWTDAEVGWGVGDQEMCITFGFADSPKLFQTNVTTAEAVGVDGDTVLFEGDCSYVVADKNPNQGPPTQEEIDGELYVPPVDPADQDIPAVPPCEDTPADAVAVAPVNFTTVRDDVFAPACSFSACHGNGGEKGGLSLDSPTLHADLLSHDVNSTEGIPLIDPGNPEGSWLYQRISRCEPMADDGDTVPHMPLNSPFLLDPGLVAKVRDWIAAGAPDD